jgi:peptide/nickel transport system substrate-binding protein
MTRREAKSLTAACTRRDLLRLGLGAAMVGGHVTALWRPEALAQAKRGGTLVAAWEAEPGSFENNMNRGAVTMRILFHLHNQLVERDLTAAGRTPPLVPGLAESWTISRDGKTYTFKLRKGVKFHDGTPFDAEAVKFNFERNYLPTAPFYHAPGAGASRQIFRAVDRIDVVDEHTVRVVQKHVYANFLVYLAHAMGSIASPTAIKKWGNQEYPNHPVGTGPFRFVERERGVKIVLERNPDYWGGPPALDRLIIQPIPEFSARVTALLTGEVDWADGIHPDLIGRLKSDRNIEVVREIVPATSAYILNTRNKPFSDPRVRQACNFAIDREVLVRDVYRGTAVPAMGTFGPTSAGHKADLKIYNYDPARAKRLLAEAGYPNGFATTWWTVPFYPTTVPMTEFVQQSFKAIGIDLKIQVFEWQTFLGTMLQKGLPNDVGAGWFAYITDETYNMDRLYDSGLQPPNGINFGWYSNPRVDQLLKKAALTIDDSERLQVYHEADRLAVEDAAHLYVSWDKQTRAYRKKVKGFIMAPSWYYTFRTVSLDG